MAAIAHARPRAAIAGTVDREEGSPAPSVIPHRSQHEWNDVLHRLSHDIRTPLNAVIGFSDIMQREMFGPLGNQRYHEYVRNIRESSDLLLQAAEEALAVSALLSAGRNQRRQPVSLVQTIDKAWRAATAHTRNDSGITLAIGNDTQILAEPLGIEHALQILLRIALERAGTETEINVGAQVNCGQTEISLTFDSAPETSAAGWPLAHRSIDGDRSFALAALLLQCEGGKLSVHSGSEGRVAMVTALETPTQSDLFQQALAGSRHS